MLGRLDRVLGMVPQREDFGSAKRHLLPILVCLEPHQTEVDKQKGQQAQNQTKCFYCLKLSTQPGLAFLSLAQEGIWARGKGRGWMYPEIFPPGNCVVQVSFFRVPDVPFKPLWGSISQVKSSPFPKLHSGFRSTPYLLPHHRNSWAQLGLKPAEWRVFKVLHRIVTAFPEKPLH